MIGIKCWVYRGEVSTDGFSRTRRSDEPRRNPRPDRRERRPDMRSDRGPAPVAAPVVEAAPVQAPPPAPVASVMPPVAQPAAPSWKAEGEPQAE